MNYATMKELAEKLVQTGAFRAVGKQLAEGWFYVVDRRDAEKKKKEHPDA